MNEILPTNPKTDTAHNAWDELWGSDEGRARWLMAEETVIAAAKQAFDKGARTAVDIGCGVGRHALGLAEMGYTVSATDMSNVGLEQVRAFAREKRLEIDAKVGSMTELPYADETFDFAVSFNVFSHGDKGIVRCAIEEARRVLKPGGILYATLLSLRSTAPCKGREVASQTFVWDDGDEDHKHPHFFSDTKTLNELFVGFEWLRVGDYHNTALSDYWHWHVVVERK
ncbi:class I SAM-dependent methyltransferase [Mesorhizobium sp. B4-1-4]|uniref:class I SAM-dependent methyltransferase n=1 Tax=Mesorhizobium sp. B4-1-4 TaxID=2589888 RepID=UPI001126E715|nr:class I SAM-dependent methyltransferase [Mesorhizobium sp. B4-1-4]UCI31753.1 class I SAM-dependent methyltransferase [Mesorhizobium sp. B4-1-4]